ncbi:hypothetical protein RRG08_067217 [Elysia crispata]|uniref:Uncharacterized protein n=1 Tax=Elysia crispata TaxID=231223 RepID=A0AAE0Y2N4_9GAST|nr:hypothetical protein RRG08_067217 [Elysia crispata]
MSRGVRLVLSEICGALAWLSPLRYAPNSFDFFLGHCEPDLHGCCPPSSLARSAQPHYRRQSFLYHGQLNGYNGQQVIVTICETLTTHLLKFSLFSSFDVDFGHDLSKLAIWSPVQLPVPL